MRLTIATPRSRPVEREYILNVLIRDFLGLDWQHMVTDRDDVCISMPGAPGTVRHPDVFFSLPDGDWRHVRSLPLEPLEQWDPGELDSSLPRVPVIYGDHGGTLPRDDGGIRLPVDVCGSAFFILSRYEEVASRTTDAHDRFPASASLASRAAFLERPLVNEYLDILWAAMATVWPRLMRRERRGSIFVTCDIDEPFDVASLRPKQLLRSVGGDLLKRHIPRTAGRRIANFVATRRGDRRFDPYNTFDWYMTTCERAGRRAAFYVIADRAAKGIDGTYDLWDDEILRLLRTLTERGHELGVHGSYNSFRDVRRIRLERERLIQACERAGITQRIVGNRQHFLRWDSRETGDHLDAVGVEYDTSGSFADAPGFRYGTSWPFNMWGWASGGPLSLRERPLNVMECSVVAQHYLGLGYSHAAIDKILTIKDVAMRSGGDFVLLWHNSHFLHREDQEFFRAAIK